MVRLGILAPWQTYQKKVKALFEKDPEIMVGDVYEPEDGNTDFAFDIEVMNHEKFLALDRVLPKQRQFGNVTLGITLFDEENAEDDTFELFATIFDGNPILKDVVDVLDPAGCRHLYVIFAAKVLQFFDDDLQDFNGNWSGLAQDIAREVFSEGLRGIHFCTEDVREAEAAEEETPDEEDGEEECDCEAQSIDAPAEE